MWHGLERDGVAIGTSQPPLQAVWKCELALMVVAGHCAALTACRRGCSVEWRAYSATNRDHADLTAWEEAAVVARWNRTRFGGKPCHTM